MELQQIIKSLNCFKTNQHPCATCPWNPHPGMAWPYGCIKGQSDIVEAAQAALESKPPVVDYGSYPRPLYTCPDCKCGLSWSEKWRCKACPECGRRIDWAGFPPERPPGDWPEYRGRYDWRLVDMLNHEGQ